MSPTSEPLGKRLFKRRLELLALLLPRIDRDQMRRAADDRGDYDALDSLRQDVVDHLHGEKLRR